MNSAPAQPRVYTNSLVVHHMQLGHDERTTDLRLREVERRMVAAAINDAATNYSIDLDADKAQSRRVTNPDRSVTVHIRVPEKEGGLW